MNTAHGGTVEANNGSEHCIKELRKILQISKNSIECASK